MGTWTRADLVLPSAFRRFVYFNSDNFALKCSIRNSSSHRPGGYHRLGISSEVKELLERVHADLSGERRIHEVRYATAHHAVPAGPPRWPGVARALGTHEHAHTHAHVTLLLFQTVPNIECAIRLRRWLCTRVPTGGSWAARALRVACTCSSMVESTRGRKSTKRWARSARPIFKMSSWMADASLTHEPAQEASPVRLRAFDIPRRMDGPRLDDRAACAVLGVCVRASGRAGVWA